MGVLHWNGGPLSLIVPTGGGAVIVAVIVAVAVTLTATATVAATDA